MANIKENKKYHYTYKTTNLINNRYYLGMHSTNRLDDGYLGSGKRLYYELNKYGRDNFKFEILEQFNSRQELIQAEVNLITEQDLRNPNCLNLKSGGQGGFISTEQQEHRSKCANKRLNEKLQNDEAFRREWKTNLINGLKRSYSEGRKDRKWGKNWLGLKHTEKTIEKMKESHKNQGKGIKNSQYGTCWITDEYQNKKIIKGDLIPEGWRLGRVLKK